MKKLLLVFVLLASIVSCSSDDNDEECDSIKDRYAKLIELAEDDSAQQEVLIRNRDDALRSAGCI